MRYSLPSAACCLWVLMLSLFAQSTGFAAEKPALSSAELFEKTAPSVVLLFNNEGVGSGSYIGNNYILTNLHVVGKEPVVGVFFKPKNEDADLDERDILVGMVAEKDSTRDLALVRVKVVPPHVQPLRFGLPKEVAIGMDVHAIGHPTGEVWTYTKGVISQIRKKFSWSAEHTANVIQTQTPINPGNSGGPLLNGQGEIIGINSFKHLKGEGLAFAVHVDELIDFVTKSKVLTSDAVATTVKARSIEELYLELGYLLELLLPGKKSGGDVLHWGFADHIKQIGWFDEIQSTPKYPVTQSGVVLMKAHGKEFYRTVGERQERVGGEIIAMGNHSGVKLVQLYPSRLAMGPGNSGATLDLLSALAVNPDLSLGYLGTYIGSGTDVVDQFYALGAKGKKTILMQFSSVVEEGRTTFYDTITLYYAIPPVRESLTRYRTDIVSRIPVSARTVELANLYDIPVIRPISFASPRPRAGEKFVISGRPVRRIPLTAGLEGVTIQVVQDEKNTLKLQPGVFANIVFPSGENLYGNSGAQLLQMLASNDRSVVRFFGKVADNNRPLWLLRNDEYLLFLEQSMKLGR